MEEFNAFAPIVWNKDILSVLKFTAQNYNNTIS